MTTRHQQLSVRLRVMLNKEKAINVDAYEVVCLACCQSEAVARQRVRVKPRMTQLQRVFLLICGMILTRVRELYSFKVH